MIIEASILVEAPPAVVYRFYEQLDHLRFISPERRREWCTQRGVSVRVGAEYEVLIRQGRHEIMLRFRTTKAEVGACIEDEFLNWPLKGARHIQTFLPENDGAATLVKDLNHWEPPWYARSAVKKHEWEQTRFFEEKLANAKRVIETVYNDLGAAAFEGSVDHDARAAGVTPVIDEHS